MAGKKPEKLLIQE